MSDDHPLPADGEPEYDRLLRANLQRVFNERDVDKREAAIAELFTADPIMYEPDNIVEGRAAISQVAGALLERFGPDFAFTPEGTAVGHHGLAALHWHAGPANGPIAVTGTDTALFVGGRISRLWVLLNSPA